MIVINKSFFKINVITSILTIFISVIIQFINRTLLVKNISIVYIGYNGLFSNIFSFLSLLELGIGPAIMYALYKPYAEGNFKKVNTYLRMYKKIYIILFIVILSIGVLLSFFLQFIINENEFYDDTILIYILFLLNSSIGYLFIYYKSILILNQKNYYLNYVTTLVSFINIIPFYVILVYTKDFKFYLMYQIFSTICLNLIIRYLAIKEVKFLNEFGKDSLVAEDIYDLKKTVFGNFIGKISGFIVFSTDNILISKFINISLVGIYSNYIILVNIINSITQAFNNPIKASVANYINTQENKNNGKDVFYIHHFLIFFINTFFSVVFYFSVNPFIKLWIGENFLLSNNILMLIVINMYITNSRNTLALFYDIYGLSKYDKVKAIVEMFLNLFLSILFLKYFNMGIFGILLGTLVSSILLPFWYEPFIIFKNVFKVSVLEYWYKNIQYILVFISINFILEYINKNIIYIEYVNFYIFIFNVFINVLITLIILLLLFYKTKIFKELVLFIKNNN